ncbi:MAG TPA: prepilin-type N-terminal cleavage/methylation domain-containing protein [Burkholderiales bacterium]|nr:prepilin-type N-terminal cleavage/methylation domain-containing protein [Burkholderiales bacterium]
MIRRGRRRDQPGFSLLELVVVIVLISILLTIAIQQLIVAKAQAERVAMQQVLGSIRSGMTIRLAELILRGKLSEADLLAGSNPMQFLAEVPQNYVGELFDPDPRSVPRGSWYFDRKEGTLCYVVDSTEYFAAASPPPARARFAIRTVFEDQDGNGRYDRGVDLLRGLQLATLEPYAWNIRFAAPDLLWARRR